MEKIDFERMFHEIEKQNKNKPRCVKCGSILSENICYSCLELEQKLKEQEQKDIERLGGLRAYKEFTLEKYDNKKILKIINYPENLYIYGPAGTGKTHLAVALIRQYKDGILFKPSKIIGKFRDCKTEIEKENLLKYFTELEHLVIDDLGTEYINDITYQHLYNIIDSKWLSMKKGLIITSNLSLDQLKNKLNDDRLTSRINGMCKIIKLEGKDRRLSNDF